MVLYMQDYIENYKLLITYWLPIAYRVWIVCQTGQCATNDFLRGNIFIIPTELKGLIADADFGRIGQGSPRNLDKPIRTLVLDYWITLSSGIIMNSTV